MTNPILLLDVDGVLNPYSSKFTPENYNTHFFTVPNGTFKVYLNPLDGEKLLSLGYDLMWATSWEDDANIHIGPNIGLPTLPVIHLPRVYSTKDWRLYFKTETILKEMNVLGRSYVWVDDAVTLRDHRFLVLNSTVPCATLRVNAATGLTDEDFERLREIRKELMIPLEAAVSHSEALSDPAGYDESPEASQSLHGSPTAFVANPTRVKV